ncbi:MAG: N-glycosylase/DNA lyase [Nitrospirae bacterium]|jgi:N-glycosylase/DNA lyase|nr:N-glycosylase/DNA lyase [Nitrospirota bacterium]
MELNKHTANQLKKLYRLKKREIISRLKEFSKIWTYGNDEEIFTELAFCILTPQSRAKSCWDAIVRLKEQDLLLKGNPAQIRQRLNCVRFRNKKAEYIVKARNLFMTSSHIHENPPFPPLLKPLLSMFTDIYECRDWLVENIKGMGYKEASHFLRNIGFWRNIAILDRHILKNLKLLNVIEEIPEALSRKKYLQIEKRMADFAMKTGIPLHHLDLLLWYKETGEIFK